jgi:hypothetical protein
MTPLAESGAWFAMAHSPSMTAPADVCIAGTTTGGFALRAAEDNLALRVIDESWTLPTAVHGDIIIDMTKYKKSFPISSNTSTMVSASIEPADLLDLLSAMDSASTMTLGIGRTQKLVDLGGSTKVTNAFRVCAGLPSGKSAATNNPFQ